MLFTDAEKELIESGELKEDDIPSLGGLSNAYVQEKVNEYVEWVKEGKDTIPAQIAMFENVTDMDSVFAFLQVERDAMMRIKMHDALVLATALQRFIDQNKYMIADAEMNDFQMEDVHIRGLIIDILIAENWYTNVLKLIENAKDEEL